MEETTQENKPEDKMNTINTSPQSAPRTSFTNQSQITGAIILAALIIGGAILLRGSTPLSDTAQNNQNNTANLPSANMRAVSADEHITGNVNARVVIVEYSDLECPYCKVFHYTMRKVLENNQNVAWVFRHYPIPQLHAKATREAEATECAWEQGGNTAFWKYVDRVFEVTTSNDGLPDAELPKIAAYIGLNETSFSSCLSSGKYASKVEADVSDGRNMGVNGTPSSFILLNGKIVDTIPGAQPYEVVMKALSEIK
ncbi:MAG TPA: DsbA family protein [Candidatus Paceibacterota bacterium]